MVAPAVPTVGWPVVVEGAGQSGRRQVGRVGNGEGGVVGSPSLNRASKGGDRNPVESGHQCHDVVG